MVSLSKDNRGADMHVGIESTPIEKTYAKRPSQVTIREHAKPRMLKNWKFLWRFAVKFRSRVGYTG